VREIPSSPDLAPSFPSFPIRRSDSPPFFTPGRFDDGIFPTPHFFSRLPSPSSLRRSGSQASSRRSGPSQEASSTPIFCSTPSTLGAHPLAFSPLTSPPLPPSSPHQPSSGNYTCNIMSFNFERHNNTYEFLQRPNYV